METNLFTLSFSGYERQYEPEFQEFFYKNSLMLFRWAFLLGIVLYAAFGILDAVSAPQQKEKIWFIRYAIVCPTLGLGVLYSFSPNFKRMWGLITSFLILLSGLGVIAMLVIIPPPTRYTYYVGLLVVIFFGTAFVNVRFLWAAFSAITLIAIFEIVSLTFYKVPISIFLQQNFFAGTTLIVGLFTSYTKELSYRKNFRLLKSLSLEKLKVSQKNEELNEILEKLRTAQNEIQALSGLLPICSRCKKIRDDTGYWNQIESYLSTHSELSFSHSICPECAKELYGKETWFKDTEMCQKDKDT